MGVVHFIVNISPIWSSKNLRTKSVVDFIFNDNLPKDLISFFPRILSAPHSIASFLEDIEHGT